MGEENVIISSSIGAFKQYNVATFPLQRTCYWIIASYIYNMSNIPQMYSIAKCVVYCALDHNYSMCDEAL